MGTLATIDREKLLDLCERGLTTSEISKELGISPQTVSKRIADLQQKQGLLLQYRQIQSLQLTELQARCLEAITPEKIEEAPLKDLVFCFKILKDKEQNLEGKASDIKGLIGYLVHLEKEDLASQMKPTNTVEVEPLYSDEDKLPEL